MPKLGCGSANAKIMLVGEAYGEREESTGEPFVGASGQELNRILHNAGITRSECYVTNVVNARPENNDIYKWIAEKKKDITSNHSKFCGLYVLPIIRSGISRLNHEVEMVNPNIVVALGNISLWALTGKLGILRWRGSQLTTPSGQKCIPVFHPAAILRQWDLRMLAVIDFKRVRKESYSKEYDNIPAWKFIIRPSFNVAVFTLQSLYDRITKRVDSWISFDLETKAGHIACAGISWDTKRGICIPFMCEASQTGYWSAPEESYLVYLLYKVLTHPYVKVRGQNLLYDCQYTYRHWHFVPRVAQDTMISHHSMWAGLRKSLDFQASMYCDHYIQWKPEKTAWKEGG